METEQHPFWGAVEADWAGFSAEKTYFMPGFDKEVTLFLGDEFDEEGEEIDTPPTPYMLDLYEVTFQQFTGNVPAILAAIKEAAFVRYQTLYTHYYEDEKQSGKPPLGIDTADAHFAFMTDLAYIRVTDEGTIKLPIYYKIDSEHDLEIKLVNGKIAEIGGMAET